MYLRRTKITESDDVGASKKPLMMEHVRCMYVLYYTYSMLKQRKYNYTYVYVYNLVLYTAVCM